jgi:hypothetical protein
MKKIISLLVALVVSLYTFAEVKGSYFNKKQYDHKPLPTYQSCKSQLPVPIFDENKEFVDMYWYAWKLAFSNLKAPEKGSPFVSNWIDEGLSPQIFQWDTNFMAMFGRYAHHLFPFIESQDNFYASQHEDGMIDRVINESDGEDHDWGKGPDNARAINPPLFSWAEVQTYRATGDKSRFALVIEPLKKYVAWIEKHRCGVDTPHRLYWSNGQASGMDNTPRDNGRKEPSDGWGCHSSIDHMGWIDMSSQMVMCYKDLAYMSKELGRDKESTEYTKRANHIADEVNKWMWDEKTGLYYDVDPEGNKTKCVSVATFWPMLAGICSNGQCARLVSNLTDTALFWRPIPVPSLAANQKEYDKMGCYWEGGVWAPTNYMVIQGLKKYGYRDVAVELTRRYLNALQQVYASTNTLWEAYSPEIFSPATNASGTHLAMPNFVGWTGLGPISMLIETMIGIEMDAPHKTLTWNISSKKRSGVEDLTFDGGKVTMIATPIQPEGYEVQLKSEKPVIVLLKTKNATKEVNVTSQFCTHIK